MGFAVVADDGARLRLVEAGAVRTSARDDLGSRLLALKSGVSRVLEQHGPTELAIEKLFFGRNTTSAVAVGQARGVAILAAAERGLPVSEYSPAEVKQSVANYGNARKEQIQEMVRILLGLPSVIQPDDAADAAAIAICHLHARAGQRMIARAAR